MGKNTISYTTTKYETLVQLLLLAAVILTPYLASTFMDLELFSVSKSLWGSIQPWLCPPYVYLLINFIIFFIVATSFIHSKTILFDPTTDLNHHPPHPPHTDSFIESSFVCPTSLVSGSLSDDDELIKFHTLEDTFKDQNIDQWKPKDVVVESMVVDKTVLKPKVVAPKSVVDKKELKPKEVVVESVVDNRELRKSKTFNEGASAHRGRKERYVRILSPEELDRRVEAFIDKIKKDKNIQKPESDMGLEFGSVY